MGQKPYKIITANRMSIILKNLFFDSNAETSRVCTKHKTEEIYYVRPILGNYALYVYDKEEAIRILNSKETIDLGGRLESDSQEEIEQITPDNIDQKSTEFLERFNKISN
jgi:hypothetical protein